MILEIQTRAKGSLDGVALWIPSEGARGGNSGISASIRPCIRKSPGKIWMRVDREDVWKCLEHGWPSMLIHDYCFGTGYRRKGRDVPAKRVKMIDDDILELLEFDL